MATYYHTDGSVHEVKPANSRFFTYEELQAFVKIGDYGMVEIVPTPSGKQMVVNEEGKLYGFPVNENATKLWMKEYPIEKYPHNNDELIVGNALVVDESELEQDEE